MARPRRHRPRCQHYAAIIGLMLAPIGSHRHERIVAGTGASRGGAVSTEAKQARLDRGLQVNARYLKQPGPVTGASTSSSHGRA